MNVILAEKNMDYYICDISANNTMISYNCSDNVNLLLIVSTEFGNIIELDDLTVDRIKNINDFENEYPVCEGKWINFFKRETDSFKAYRIERTPYQYAIYACRYNSESDELTIYVDNANQCSISACIKSEIQRKKKPVRKGFFKKKVADIEYAEIRIDEVPGYKDGALYYTYDGFNYKYPISKKMLGKSFKVNLYNGNSPIIKSSGMGYTLG